jgi:hypothetical protein
MISGIGARDEMKMGPIGPSCMRQPQGILMMTSALPIVMF